jgi:hypothetical protein
LAEGARLASGTSFKLSRSGAHAAHEWLHTSLFLAATLRAYRRVGSSSVHSGPGRSSVLEITTGVLTCMIHGFASGSATRRWRANDRFSLAEVPACSRAASPLTARTGNALALGPETGSPSSHPQPSWRSNRSCLGEGVATLLQQHGVCDGSALPSRWRGRYGLRGLRWPAAPTRGGLIRGGGLWWTPAATRSRWRCRGCLGRPAPSRGARATDEVRQVPRAQILRVVLSSGRDADRVGGRPAADIAHDDGCLSHASLLSTRRDRTIRAMPENSLRSSKSSASYLESPPSPGCRSQDGCNRRSGKIRQC